MKQIRIRLIVALTVCIMTFIVLRYTGVGSYLSFENLRNNIDSLRLLVDKHYFVAVALYCLVYLISIASAIPAVAPLSMVGGFLFGVIPAVVYAAISATTGALVSFLFFSYLIAQGDKERVPNKFTQQIERHGASYLLVMHFLVVIPYLVINMAAAIAHVPLWTFIWTTFVGFIPVALVYSFAGKELATIESGWDLFSGKIIFVMASLIVLAILPIIIKRFKKVDVDNLAH